MHITTDRAFVPAGTPVVRYLHIVLNAPGRRQDETTRPAASVALVLDRSGSMDGQKMTMAREAVAHATKLLRPTDHLALVCYDEDVTTILERTPATAEAKKVALERLAKVSARGSTDLHAGWLQGAQQVQPTATDASVTKVMLLTDGLANHGIVDADEIIAAAQRLREAGVTTSTFGVGQDFNEHLLSRMATAGGGHFYFIERPKQIPDFLASELGETLEVVARDVVLQIDCDPGVDAMIVNELPAERHDDRVSIRLGNLVADQELEIVVAAVFKGSQGKGASLGVQCRVTDRDGVLPDQPMAVKWEAVDALTDANQRVNGDVMFAAATMLAERARRDALAANAAGNLEGARRLIQEVLNDLRAFAQDDRRVLQIIDSLHRDELEFGEAMDPMLMKARHFASYQVLHSREAGGTAKRKRH
jgi:Ca-activated chloride channel family protein